MKTYVVIGGFDYEGFDDGLIYAGPNEVEAVLAMNKEIEKNKRFGYDVIKLILWEDGKDMGVLNEKTRPKI